MKYCPKKSKVELEDSANLVFLGQIMSGLVHLVQVLYYLLGPRGPVFRIRCYEDVVRTYFERSRSIKMFLLEIFRSSMEC